MVYEVKCSGGGKRVLSEHASCVVAILKPLAISYGGMACFYASSEYSNRSQLVAMVRGCYGVQLNTAICLADHIRGYFMGMVKDYSKEGILSLLLSFVTADAVIKSSQTVEITPLWEVFPYGSCN